MCPPCWGSDRHPPVCPLVPTVPSPSLCWLAYGFSWPLFWAAPLPTPQCPPFLTLLVSLEGVALPRDSCCPRWQGQLSSPDTREMSPWVDSCHITSNTLTTPMPMPLTCFSPEQFPHFCKWWCDSCHAQGSSSKPCLKQCNVVPRIPGQESHGVQLETLLCYSGVVELLQISEPVSSTTKWAK